MTNKQQVKSNVSHKCAYCGEQPAFEVVWKTHQGKSSVWLCASCDEAESNALKNDGDACD